MGSSLTGSVFNSAKTQEVINNESFEVVAWSPLFCGIHYTPVVISNAGEIAIGCEPDNSGRQVLDDMTSSHCYLQNHYRINEAVNNHQSACP